jgi:hypothetical protein
VRAPRRCQTNVAARSSAAGAVGSRSHGVAYRRSALGESRSKVSCWPVARFVGPAPASPDRRSRVLRVAMEAPAPPAQARYLRDSTSIGGWRRSSTRGVMRLPMGSRSVVAVIKGCRDGTRSGWKPCRCGVFGGVDLDSSSGQETNVAMLMTDGCRCSCTVTARRMRTSASRTPEWATRSRHQVDALDAKPQRGTLRTTGREIRRDNVGCRPNQRSLTQEFGK